MVKNMCKILDLQNRLKQRIYDTISTRKHATPDILLKLLGYDTDLSLKVWLDVTIVVKGGG